jgi:hypothetical protein
MRTLYRRQQLHALDKSEVYVYYLVLWHKNLFGKAVLTTDTIVHIKKKKRPTRNQLSWY